MPELPESWLARVVVGLERASRASRSSEVAGLGLKQVRFLVGGVAVLKRRAVDAVCLETSFEAADGPKSAERALREGRRLLSGVLEENEPRRWRCCC